jgi:hypothetical protein
MNITMAVILVVAWSASFGTLNDMRPEGWRKALQ